MAVPQTMLERQGGRSLKTSNLLGEEWQWAQKASAMDAHTLSQRRVCFVCGCIN